MHEESKLLEGRDDRGGRYHQQETQDPRVPYTVSTGGRGNIAAVELRHRQSQHHQPSSHGHNHHHHHDHRRGSTSSSTATVQGDPIGLLIYYVLISIFCHNLSGSLFDRTQVITPSASLQHIPNCSAATAASSSSASTLPSNHHRETAPATNSVSRSRSRSVCVIQKILN